MASTCIAALVFAALTQIETQITAPEIAGTWVVVPEASIWRDQLGSPVNIRILGEGFVVRQDDRILSIAIDNEKGFVWRYNLDGTESHNLLPLPRGDEATTSKVTVQRNKIMITTCSRYEGVTRTTNRTIELNVDDGTLRVEAPFGEHGAMIGTVYRRVNP